MEAVQDRVASVAEAAFELREFAGRYQGAMLIVRLPGGRELQVRLCKRHARLLAALHPADRGSPSSAWLSRKELAKRVSRNQSRAVDPATVSTYAAELIGRLNQAVHVVAPNESVVLVLRRRRSGMRLAAPLDIRPMLPKKPR